MGAIEDLKRALADVAPDLFGAMLWGSHATGRAHEGSDIDVCLVAGKDAELSQIDQSALQLAGRLGPRFDVKVFETLPLYLKGEVIEGGVVVAALDEPALWEYLRDFRKVWEDQSVRRHGREEFERLLEARRRSRA